MSSAARPFLAIRSFACIGSGPWRGSSDRPRRSGGHLQEPPIRARCAPRREAHRRFHGRDGRALRRRDADRQPGRHFCASARDSRRPPPPSRRRTRATADGCCASSASSGRCSRCTSTTSARASPSSSRRCSAARASRSCPTPARRSSATRATCWCRRRVAAGITVSPVPGAERRDRGAFGVGPALRPLLLRRLPARARRGAPPTARRTRRGTAHARPVRSAAPDRRMPRGSRRRLRRRPRRACIARELTKRFETFYRGGARASSPTRAKVGRRTSRAARR